MTGKYSWIALFALLQISVVLCRSTEKPKDEEKVLHEGPIFFIHGRDSVGDSIDEYFGKNVQGPTLKSPTPNVRKQENVNEVPLHTFPTQTRLSESARIGAIIGTIAGVLFVLGSLITGLIAYCCFPSKPRPGIILSNNTAQCGIQHHGNN